MPFCTISRIKSETFTANGTWTAPNGVTQALIVGCGGGGGGRATGSSTPAAGGNGGEVGSVLATVVPGTGYAVSLGAGGASDSTGSNTTVGALATFVGGTGGGLAENEAGIASPGRGAKGVKLVTLASGDKLLSIARIVETDEEQIAESSEAPPADTPVTP